MLPKYVKRVRAKGREYLYFDTGKTVDGKRVYARLPGLRDVGFGGSYAALLGHRNRAGPVEQLRIPQLVDLYQRSPGYRSNSVATMKLYDIYLRRLEKLLPTAPVVEVTRGDMRRLIDKMAETPGAANAFLSTASALFAWGVDHEYVPTNPCAGITDLPGGEHQPWPDNVLTAALGAKDADVRLLAHLLYYTGQRIGDVLRMAWSDVAGEHLGLRQQKTGKVLTVRLHEALRAELATRSRTGILICVNAAGRPLSGDMARKKLQTFAASMGAKIVPHGLRKNAVIALLEAGCSMAETAAVSGQTLRMVEHYAKQRDQRSLADTAVLRWENRK